jgi:nicotinamidase-related amidase
MRILAENSFALVIDIQEKLLPHIHEQQQMIMNTEKLIEGLKILGVSVIVTEQYRKGLGSTANEISRHFSDFQPLEKISFSCCDDVNILKAISDKNKKNIILCGIESHICVLQTSIDLTAKGFNPVVVTDCISSRKPEDKTIALERMRHEGAILTTYESVLFELCRFAGTDPFKEISKLVK